MTLTSMELALQPSPHRNVLQGLGLPELSLEKEVTWRVLIEREGEFIALGDLATTTSVPGAARRSRAGAARGGGGGGGPYLPELHERDDDRVEGLQLHAVGGAREGSRHRSP